jgi:hypothetical protein
MLEFYYDFIDYYIDKSDYQYCMMDTDSAYFAILGNCLEQVIKRLHFGFAFQGSVQHQDAHFFSPPYGAIVMSKWIYSLVIQ